MRNLFCKVHLQLAENVMLKPLTFGKHCGLLVAFCFLSRRQMEPSSQLLLVLLALLFLQWQGSVV